MDDLETAVSGWSVRSFVAAVLPRPRLWWVALRSVFRLAAPGWWHRWPPLPVPPRDYWRFRITAAYGQDGDDRQLSADDVVSYLDWCRTRQRRGS